MNFTWKSTGQRSQSKTTVMGTIDGEAIAATYSYLGVNSNNERSLEKP